MWLSCVQGKKKNHLTRGKQAKTPSKGKKNWKKKIHVKRIGVGSGGLGMQS